MHSELLGYRWYQFKHVKNRVNLLHHGDCFFAHMVLLGVSSNPCVVRVSVCNISFAYV